MILHDRFFYLEIDNLWRIRKIAAIGSFAILYLICPCVTNAQTSVHIAILGDSNTWLGGDECDKPQGWTYWLCEQLKPASCHSYARSGATWTHTSATKRNVWEYTEKISDDNVIFNQICRLQEAVEIGSQPLPQMVIIAAGTNDAWFTQKRPKALDILSDNITKHATNGFTDLPPNEMLTLADAVMYDCELLQNSFPKSSIVFLTPMQSTAVSAGKICAVSDILEGVAQQVSAEVIRMDKESCVRSNQEKEHHLYTYDGTHTNEKGACRNGYYIAQQLSTMLQQK